MSFFNTMNISASGLTAQRLRMDVISQNLANVDTTKTANGTPYKRQTVLFEEATQAPFSTQLNNAMSSDTLGRGVKVSGIAEDQTPGSMVYDPTHPHADENGYVEMPNVNVVKEMVNMMSASRSYESNITAMNITKSMIAKTLEISASR